MLLELGAEITQRSERRTIGAGEAVCQVPDPQVIRQDLGDDRPIDLDEPNAGGKQNLLLLAKVLSAIGLPVGGESIRVLAAVASSARFKRWATTSA